MANKTTRSSKKSLFVDEPEMQPEFNKDDFGQNKPSTAENIISIGLGLAVVLVIGAMIINVIKNRNPEQKTDTTTQEQEKMATLSATHTVQAGETLWSIAEKYYQDGFKWVEIQKANSIPTNSNLEKGRELMIPKISDATISESKSTNAPLQASSMPTALPHKDAAGSTGPTGGLEEHGQTSSASTDKQHTVVSGDSLWAIAVKHYNNGYRWVEIAKLNNLKNPDVIHAGNVLMLP
jgi:nucleoid-associated protein YgaU